MGNIVWMASYPKSGNTWVRAFLQNYLSASDQPSNINGLDGFFANESNPSWYRQLVGADLSSLNLAEICRYRPEVQRSIANSRNGTIMVKTHNFLGEYEGLALHNMAVTSGAVCVVRNPLDIVISLADHFGLSIDEAILFMGSEATGTPMDDNNVASVLTSWSTHVESWSRDTSGSTHVIRYEDLLDKPQKHFGKLLSFLGLERNPGKLKRAVQNSSFDSLRKQESRQGFIERSPNSKRFFRSGKKNQWRELLSAKQISALINDHRVLMKQFKYLPTGHK